MKIYALKRGDVVVLKSGGPDMVITSINDDEKCACTWKNADNQKQVYTFPAACLVFRRRPLYEVN